MSTGAPIADAVRIHNNRRRRGRANVGCVCVTPAQEAGSWRGSPAASGSVRVGTRRRPRVPHANEKHAPKGQGRKRAPRAQRKLPPAGSKHRSRSCALSDQVAAPPRVTSFRLWCAVRLAHASSAPAPPSLHDFAMAVVPPRVIASSGLRPPPPPLSRRRFTSPASHANRRRRPSLRLPALAFCADLLTSITAIYERFQEGTTRFYRICNGGDCAGAASRFHER